MANIDWSKLTFSYISAFLNEGIQIQMGIEVIQRVQVQHAVMLLTIYAGKIRQRIIGISSVLEVRAVHSEETISLVSAGAFTHTGKFME